MNPFSRQGREIGMLRVAERSGKATNVDETSRPQKKVGSFPFFFTVPFKPLLRTFPAVPLQSSSTSLSPAYNGQRDGKRSNLDTVATKTDQDHEKKNTIFERLIRVCYRVISTELRMISNELISPLKQICSKLQRFKTTTSFFFKIILKTSHILNRLPPCAWYASNAKGGGGFYRVTTKGILKQKTFPFPIIVQIQMCSET